MKKLLAILMTLCVTASMALTGCSADNANADKVGNAQAGEVVELEGQQDQYGWFPHMRLTFDGDVLTEVYFDYVDDAGAKKSQDEEYNATMKEKTGVSVKDAMDALRENLIAVQDPDKVDIVTGATQTSTEFKNMAKQAYEQYKNGENSANNYGKGDPTDNTDDGESSNTNESSDNNGTDSVTYENGGDGSPNNPENAANAESESGSESGSASEGGAGGTGAGAPATNE